MAYKLYKDGNYLVIDNTITGGLEFTRPLSKCYTYVKEDKLFVKADDGHIASFNISELIDAEDVAIDEAGAIEFSRKSTGFSTAVGGSTAGNAFYEDTQYTSASPFSISANTKTALPNKLYFKVETFLPTGVDTYYDGVSIKGKKGDAVAVTVEFRITPTLSTDYIQISLDVGGATGDRIKKHHALPGGIKTKAISKTFVYPQTQDWEDNGARVMLFCNSDCSVYDVKYAIVKL